jgi:hypothetical protein
VGTVKGHVSNILSKLHLADRTQAADQMTTGVLIMSITVDQPATYTFTCHFEDGRTKPTISVALGPNYVWEFLKTAGHISLPLLGALVISGSSLTAGLLMILIAALRRRSL